MLWSKWKINFRYLSFLVLEIWSFKILRIIWRNFFRPKRCAMFWNWFCTTFDNFAIFSFWDNLLYIRSELGTQRFLRTWFRNANLKIPDNQLTRGIQSKSIRGHGAEPPNMKIFLNSSNPNSLRMSSTKSAKLSQIEWKISFRTLGIFWDE